MGNPTVKIGFVPSYRFRYTPWCQKMRDDSLAAFARIPGLEIIVPQESPDGTALDAERGYTPYGMVATLDEAEAAAEYFRRQHVDGLILCPLDFGDERSAVKVAENLARAGAALRHEGTGSRRRTRPWPRLRFLLRQPVHGLGPLPAQDRLPLRRHLLPR